MDSIFDHITYTVALELSQAQTQMMVLSSLVSWSIYLSKSARLNPEYLLKPALILYTFELVPPFELTFLQAVEYCCLAFSLMSRWTC